MSLLFHNHYHYYQLLSSLYSFIGNCGGGGTCGTCVVQVQDNEFWEQRPDFEAKKLKKYDEKCRLSCNTIIEGDCKVIIQPMKKEV